MIVKIAFWSFVSIALTTFIVETAFIQAMTYKRFYKDGTLKNFPFEFRAQAYFWGILGLLADFVFNHTRGYMMFGLFAGPPGILFSSRVQWWCDDWAANRYYGYVVSDKTAARYAKAVRWKKILNAIDPGHIREWREPRG